MPVLPPAVVSVANPARLYDRASELLNAAVSALVAAGQSVPVRQYVHFGEVAWDCEQLVVTIERLRPGQPDEDPRPFRCVAVPSVVLQVWLVRCVPNPDDGGRAPSAASLDASAEGLLRDTWVLWRGLTNAYVNGALFDRCDNVRFDDAEPFGPEGGFAATRVRVTLEVLDG